TTFNVITETGEFIGGVIAPGIKGSLDSLVSSAAKLPNVELELPEKIIAKNTVTNMQAGLLYGFAGLVENVVLKMKRELGRDAFVVATGGLSETIIKELPSVNAIDRTLTLDGLKILYDMNKEENE
ncbi:MAG: type III pantothenate kinase, partial [Clostridia bacterium]|nr:type III pantothenate kinase [Clostridia bacterium]